ncbi:MAG: YfhO family protein [Lachnospiraceae bacterium]|nr:YfhO family protein [Lachnospiraceae bacterium]
MTEGNTLFTTIPYDTGWTVKIDGRESDYYNSNAFIGIDMEPGEHTVEMVYVPKGLYTGMIISFISWLLFIMGTMYNSHKKDSKKLVKNNNDEIDLNENI